MRKWPRSSEWSDPRSFGRTDQNGLYRPATWRSQSTHCLLQLHFLAEWLERTRVTSDQGPSYNNTRHKLTYSCVELYCRVGPWSGLTSLTKARQTTIPDMNLHSCVGLYCRVGPWSGLTSLTKARHTTIPDMNLHIVVWSSTVGSAHRRD